MLWSAFPRAVKGVSLFTLGWLLCLSARPASADCLLDEVPNTTADNLVTLFPNWLGAPVGVFDIQICTDTACPGTPACNIQSLTIYNYGTANGTTDLTKVFFNLACGAKTNVTATMTYAGSWLVGGKNLAAWTWAGPIVWGGDPGGNCPAGAQLSVYADVGACPANGAEVTMGLGYNDVVNPVTPGGLWDTCGCQVPSYQEVRTGRTKYIQYVTKTADKSIVSPGDTVTYTVYYGKPGATITGFVITDSLPAYTHYVAGSAVPAPDILWDPDLGPPMRLRWTLPGPASTTGGPTAELRFAVTADWGNGEIFEPGSGDIAAPEGSRLANVAAVEFPGAACPNAQMNPPVDAIVRRYLVWKTADQDILFAPRYGMPDDEIIYSIYVRNMSPSRTWWQLSVWDTVPPELTTWGIDSGVYDNCISAWTMTPTAGCSPATPGYLANAARTLLTWKLDLPPGATLQLQWKAKVKAAGVTAGATAVSKVSVMALGAPGQVGGTGHAGLPRTFLHVAPIVLRTTYFSYVAQAADSTSCAGLKINLYPLNKAASFELRKLFYSGAGFASVGGKSASISALEGTCLGGYVDGGYAGCGPERAPSQYEWPGGLPCPSAPNAALFKLTGNAPVDWLLMPEVGGGGDAFTYIPSTSFSHSGFTHYSFRRSVSGNSTPGWGESWVVFNTSLDVGGTFDPTTSTTVHIFRWDPTTLTWNYVIGNDIDANSLWMPFAGCAPPDEAHYKIISSDERLLVYQGYGTIGDPNITFSYNDHGNMVPNAENGLKVSTPGSAGTFYAVCFDDPTGVSVQMVVGNESPTTKAFFRVYHYRPRNPGLASSGIPASLCDNSGSWDLYGVRSADPGLAGLDNAHVFGAAFDHLTAGTGGTANAWKIEWQSGGPISVLCGTYCFSAWAGGSVIHAVNGKATGQEFWFHTASNTSPNSWAVTVFCHSANMGVNATSGDGMSATYTSDGPDQCIMFTDFSPNSFGGRRNYSFKLTASGAQGELVTQYHQGEYREKFFTAPFVVTGVHYDILAPPVVFSGQPFWITIAVVLGSGNTKVDYCGTTSFTSTDPLGLIEGLGMDTYNFTWSSATACSVSPNEDGVRIFANVVLTKLGLQSLSAIDVYDGSINGVAAIDVIGVDVKLAKEPRLSVAASGDTVRFRICWSNYSATSAFAFTITDAIPMGTTYVPDTATNSMCGAPPGVTADVAYSLATSATPPPPASFVTVPPATLLPAGVRWLRWTIHDVTVNATGCACYRLSVN